MMRFFGMLCLASLVMLGAAQAGEKALVPQEEGTCGDYGTTVEFVDSPKEAAHLAKKDGKLVFVLHVSGNFEDPRFT
jgi:hypothetical protein